ncbi:MAG: AAA family ATPase [Burkholderiales bacterium]|jgi:chromosome partitioning protein
MPIIAVLNPKGGVGKSTLATQVAGYYASQGHSVVLGDIDRQGSARDWLAIRPAEAASIKTWDLESGLARPPKGATHIVLDTPAQIGEGKLERVLDVVDGVLVPLQPSMFDILATRPFLETLRKHYKKDDRLQRHVALVGMKVDARTRSAEQWRRFVDQLGLPVAGVLRDTQNYVQLAAHGLTMFDVAPHRVQADLLTWQPIAAWLDSRA